MTKSEIFDRFPKGPYDLREVYDVLFFELIEQTLLKPNKDLGKSILEDERFAAMDPTFRATALFLARPYRDEVEGYGDMVKKLEADTAGQTGMERLNEIAVNLGSG